MKNFLVCMSLVLAAIGCSNPKSATATNARDVEVRAIELINELPASPKNNSDIALELRNLHVDPQGREHVRFNRKYRDLQIIGGDLVTHLDNRNKASSVDQASSDEFNLETAPKVTIEDANKIATKKFKGTLNKIINTSLVIFAHEKNSPPKLAWDVLLDGIQENNLPSEKHFFIDANTSELMASWDDIHSALGTGNGFHNGTFALEVTREPSLLYSLKDPLRGNLFTVNWLNQAAFTNRTNVFGDGRLAIAATAAADAQFGTAMTWDYFKLVHGRNGIRNNGIGSKSDVHWGRNSNAFWSDTCFCATYGDGDSITTLPFVTLDIVGHELAHGVTSATAKLVYSGESGGLNEATSDIFGTMVEFYANVAKDVADYTIGEKIFRNGTSAIRFMYNPNLDGSSPNCYSPTLGSLDVHHSSGVANHFFYLLAEGSNPPAPLPPSPTCNGAQLVGIGRDAAARIWYRALTLYMVSNTNYAGARVATIKAAEDLFGIGSTQASAVGSAWAAVSVEAIVAPPPPVNASPTAVALSSAAVSENLSIGTIIGNLTTQDPNSGDTFTYSLSGPDAVYFKLAGNVLQSNVVFNFEEKSSYSVLIQSTDPGGLPISNSFTISILNANDPSTDVLLSPASVNENVPIGTTVGTLTTIDADVGQTFSYALSGADAASFRIVGSSLTTAAIFNSTAKNLYSLTISSTDNTGVVFLKVLNVTINAVSQTVNLAPTQVNLSRSSLAENLPAGTVIGNLSTLDPNVGDTFTYSLSGTNAASFRISGTALVANSTFDYEAKRRYSIIITSRDSGGLSVMRAITISIKNVKDPK